MAKSRLRFFRKQSSKLMLLLFVMTLAWGGNPKQHVPVDSGLSYHHNSSDEITLRNASGNPSLNQLFNQDDSFDWAFGEVIIDLPGLEIANAKAQLAGPGITNVFYNFISINAP